MAETTETTITLTQAPGGRAELSINHEKAGDVLALWLEAHGREGITLGLTRARLADGEEWRCGQDFDVTEIILTAKLCRKQP